LIFEPGLGIRHLHTDNIRIGVAAYIAFGHVGIERILRIGDGCSSATGAEYLADVVNGAAVGVRHGAGPVVETACGERGLQRVIDREGGVRRR
jgi:hypothetical protein